MMLDKIQKIIKIIYKQIFKNFVDKKIFLNNNLSMS